MIYHDNLFKTVTLDALVGKNGNTQPCLTSAENLANAIAYAKEFLAKSPALKTLTFAPAPGTAKNCTCNACAALDTEENTPTGAYIRFINAIIESVKADYPTLSFEIKMSGCFLSLPATERPADGVSIFMSTEECHATHPLTDADCPTSQTFVEALQAWSKITSVRLEYVLSATEYLSTFANLNTLRENMRLFAESGIDSLYCSGNFSCPSGEFGELRAYLINALLQNPTMSEEEYDEHTNELLATYYGDGWFYIRNYINKITELANNDVSENDACGQSATDSPLTVITRTEYRNYAYQFDNCWNAAEQLAGDRIEAVKGSRIQWQYIQVCLNPNEADAQALINAVSAANLCWRKDLRSVAAESSLTLAPTSWKYAQ